MLTPDVTHAIALEHFMPIAGSCDLPSALESI